MSSATVTTRQATRFMARAQSTELEDRERKRFVSLGCTPGERARRRASTHDSPSVPIMLMTKPPTKPAPRAMLTSITSASPALSSGIPTARPAPAAAHSPAVRVPPTSETRIARGHSPFPVRACSSPATGGSSSAQAAMPMSRVEMISRPSVFTWVLANAT